MIVSVVVPTFNRGARLKTTLESILACETTGLDRVEVIVVDDGSSAPAAPMVESLCASPPFALHCPRQANAGPAAARNAGYRAARGEVVLFVDDDMICPPGLLLQHLAAHRERPGCVILGPYPFVPPDRPTPFFRYMGTLGYHPELDESVEFIETTFVASGQISVERAMFDPEEGVYRTDLQTPVAEEYELAWRLKRLGIPVLFAPRITALHNRSVDVVAMCRQSFTHGRGCAEVAVKYPGTLEIKDLKRILDANAPALTGGPLRATMKAWLKGIVSTPAVRSPLLQLVRIAEQVVRRESLMAPFYRGVLGTYFCAGVRDGLCRYSGGNAGLGQPSPLPRTS